MKILVIFCYLSVVSLNFSTSTCKDNKPSGTNVSQSEKPAWALLRSPGGCILRATYSVHQFVTKDMKQYENIVYDRKTIQKTILDERNEVYFLNENDEMLEHIYLDRYKREEINKIFLNRGFKKKENLVEPTENSKKKRRLKMSRKPRESKRQKRSEEL